LAQSILDADHRAMMPQQCCIRVAAHVRAGRGIHFTCKRGIADDRAEPFVLSGLRKLVSGPSSLKTIHHAADLMFFMARSSIISGFVRAFRRT
jgi:hypothetical protein